MIINKTKNKTSSRLTSFITPHHYNLTIAPDILSGSYTGSELIKIKILKITNSITLHAKDINIEMAQFKFGKITQFATKTIYDTKAETVTFHFKDKIVPAKGELSIKFRGIINDNLRGFYKSKYILDGEEKFLATTQFESTDARRCFPCFDEPAHKAIFEVSLIIPENHTAISNTLPTSIKEHSAGYKIVSFSPTPIMSTYLLAFIIGEFEYIEGYAKGGAKSLNNFSRSGPSSSLVPACADRRGPEKLFGDDATKHSSDLVNNHRTLVRVYTTKGKIHQAKFALDVAIRSIEFYNDYFDIPYPLETLDLIAIPDFESAAMENWGAVTFRETAILVDEEHTSLSNKQWAAIVIAHELAHQWFGNLVTMSWWTDLWLNEGFASYMENYCVDHLFPDWQIWDLYISDRYSLALRLDALSNSHPIEVEVNHPDEISEIFDMVSYAKGSAVIRMLAEYLGDDKFRDGLRHYLKKHSYKNTVTTDLWQSFEKVSKKPVTKMMSSWTKQTGYPLLTLTKKNNRYSLSQERFFSSRISASNFFKSKVAKNTWQTPLKYESQSEPSESLDIMNLLMTKKAVPLLGCVIGKINKNEETFARIRYDNETLDKLGNDILNKKMSVLDRLGIIRDMFAMAEGGYLKTIDALEFSLSYKEEEDFIVWSEIAQGINKIANIIGDESFKEKYNLYALSLFSPLSQKMGWEKKKGENHADTFLRNLALSMAAHYGDEKAIRQAKKLFKNRNKSSIRADIRGVVYTIVAEHGSESEWKLFEKLYEREEFQEEKDRFARALTSFKDRELLLKTLNFALSPVVRNQDAPQIISQVWQKHEGRDITWKFMRFNWKIILEKFGEGGFISRLISSLGGHTKLKDLNDAKKFFASHIAPGSERTLVQAYEKIESNAAWIANDKQSIKDWLNKNY